MALTDVQRKELEEMTPENVRDHLAQIGGGLGAAVPFRTGDMTRSDVIAWLAEKNRDAAQTQGSILWWAKVAGIAAIIGVVVAIAIPLIGK